MERQINAEREDLFNSPHSKSNDILKQVAEKGRVSKEGKK
jgi:hypothetical protein